MTEHDVSFLKHNIVTVYLWNQRVADLGRPRTLRTGLFFAHAELRNTQKNNFRMGIFDEAVTIWASSRARVSREDPNW